VKVLSPAADDQSGVRNRVMRRLKRPPTNERLVGRKHIVHRLDACHLERFFEHEVGED
jgi:hypothetical protein